MSFADYFLCEVIEIKQRSGGLLWHDILLAGKVGEDITIFNGRLTVFMSTIGKAYQAPTARVLVCICNLHQCLLCLERSFFFNMYFLLMCYISNQKVDF